MKAEQISQALSDIDRELLIDAAPGPADTAKKRKKRLRLTAAAAAAVLALVLILSSVLGPGGTIRAYCPDGKSMTIRALL